MDQLKTELTGLISSGMYGFFGSFVHYMYRIRTKREPTFKFAIFALNGLFGFYIGLVVGSFIPEAFESRDGVIMVSGFLVYQIFDYLESRGLEKIKEKLGIEDKNDPQ